MIKKMQIAVAVLVLAGLLSSLRAERIKDIVDIGGVRSNSLSGVGLVVGLSGTGDSDGVKPADAYQYIEAFGTGSVARPDEGRQHCACDGDGGTWAFCP